MRRGLEGFKEFVGCSGTVLELVMYEAGNDCVESPVNCRESHLVTW